MSLEPKIGLARHRTHFTVHWDDLPHIGRSARLGNFFFSFLSLSFTYTD